MSTPLPLLKSLQESVKRAADQQVGPGMHSGLQDALNSARAVDPEQREEFRRLVARIVPDVESPTGAGQLAIWLGSSVEAGCPAEATASPLVDAFLRWSRQLVTTEAAEDPAADEDQVIGLQMLGQALVAHVSSDQALRTSIGACSELQSELDRIEDLTPGAWWLRGLLLQRSGTLNIVHLDQKMGIRLSYSNVTNCFHLLTLIQGQLEGALPGARPADAQVMSVAMGETWDEVTDEAWWDYLVVESGALVALDGQQSPESIPSHDGAQVIFVRAASTAGLSWDGGFFAPVLSASPPKVSLDRPLTAAEVSAIASQV